MTPNRHLSAFVLLLTSAVMVIAAPQWNPHDGFSQVATEVTPAVVFIHVEKTISTPGVRGGQLNDPSGHFDDEFLRRFFGPRYQQPGGHAPREYKQQGQGSGFIITRDGYILTNSHVVGDADKVTVRLKDGREFTAKKTWSDPKSEVAMIKIDADELPTLKLGSSSKLKTGEWAIAVGNPFGLSETLTVGVVSAIGRSSLGLAEYEDFIQTDAAINPGNSGGPLINIDGEAIGINTAIYSRSGGYMGIGFAIPIDMAIDIKDRLLRDGYVTRGFVGISMNPTPMDAEMAETFGLKQPGGVLIADVIDDGPAAKAGLLPGDVITEIEGDTVKDNATFRNRVAMTAPGTRIVLTISRNGKQQKTPIEIGTLPGGDLPADAIDDDAAEKLGLSVQSLTPELAEQLNLDNAKGVLITDVTPDSPAADAGLTPGQLILEVNRKPIPNVDAFNRAVQAASDNENILLRVKARNGTWFALIRID